MIAAYLENRFFRLKLSLSEWRKALQRNNNQIPYKNEDTISLFLLDDMHIRIQMVYIMGQIGGASVLKEEV